MLNSVPIALLGPNDLVREGLRHILSEERFEVVSSSRQCSDVVAAMKRNGSVFFKEQKNATKKPLIVLVDQSSGTYSYEDFAEIYASNDTEVRIVFLDEKLDVENMIECFRNGAHGYIIINVGCECLLESLQLVALGEKVLPSALVELLPQLSFGNATFLPSSTDKRLEETLSSRETEILRCLIIGLPNKLIARRLDLSEATVKVHVKAILRKLGVRNRTQAAIYALNHGMSETFRTSGSEPSGTAPESLAGKSGPVLLAHGETVAEKELSVAG